MYHQISDQDARHVLWYFGARGGLQPGSFTQLLMGAFAAADPVNFAKLSAAFPGMGKAMDLAKNHLEGIELLQEQVGL